MIEPKFTEIERRLMGIFFKRGPAKTLTADEIGTLIYNGRKRPKNWRGCVHVRMRNLSLKHAAGSDRLVIGRVSPLGRSNQAEYGLQRR